MPSPKAVPVLSTAQMQEVARLLVEVYQIQPIQTMENGGRSLALLAKLLLTNDTMDRPIVVLTGCGTNGGHSLVAARHLLNWGAWVQLVLTHPVEAYGGLVGQQLAILQAMGTPLAWAEEGWELPPADLMIDAMMGDDTHLAPAGKTRDLIQLANSSRAPILSVEAPSGLDTTTGQLFTPHIQATATMLLALPQRGLLTAASACGALYLADIGVPPQLYADIGVDVPLLFAHDTILSLTRSGESVTAYG